MMDGYHGFNSSGRSVNATARICVAMSKEWRPRVYDDQTLKLQVGKSRPHRRRDSESSRARC